MTDIWLTDIGLRENWLKDWPTFGQQTLANRHLADILFGKQTFGPNAFTHRHLADIRFGKQDFGKQPLESDTLIRKTFVRMTFA
jgi:hypothetical protein